MSEQAASTEIDAPVDHLGLFLQFADAVRAAHERAHRPVYAETCPCGGSVEVGRLAAGAERRRIWSTFVGRHQHCLTRVNPPGSSEVSR